MRVKKGYMGNDQLLLAYNMQIVVCDEYITTIDVKQYVADTDCFIPLMEKFKAQYKNILNIQLQMQDVDHLTIIILPIKRYGKIYEIFNV